MAWHAQSALAGTGSAPGLVGLFTQRCTPSDAVAACPNPPPCGILSLGRAPEFRDVVVGGAPQPWTVPDREGSLSNGAGQRARGRRRWPLCIRPSTYFCPLRWRGQSLWPPCVEVETAHRRYEGQQPFFTEPHTRNRDPARAREAGSPVPVSQVLCGLCQETWREAR
jgi:hypothetical protein